MPEERADCFGGCNPKDTTCYDPSLAEAERYCPAYKDCKIIKDNNLAGGENWGKLNAEQKAQAEEKLAEALKEPVETIKSRPGAGEKKKRTRRTKAEMEAAATSSQAVSTPAANADASGVEQDLDAELAGLGDIKTDDTAGISVNEQAKLAEAQAKTDQDALDKLDKEVTTGTEPPQDSDDLVACLNQIAIMLYGINETLKEAIGATEGKLIGGELPKKRGPKKGSQKKAGGKKRGPKKGSKRRK